MVACLRRARKRAQWPEWGVPAAALLIAIDGHRRGPWLPRPAPDEVGAAFEAKVKTLAARLPLRRHVRHWLEVPEFAPAAKSSGASPAFARRIRQLLVRIRQLGWLSLAQHRCKSLPLDMPGGGGGGKTGHAAQRLIHMFDPVAMAWFGAARRRWPPFMVPAYFHGGLPGRCREGAILAQQATAWRVAKAGRTVLLVLVDATNAFSCCSHAEVGEVAERWLHSDAMFARDWVEWARMTASTFDGA